MACRREIFEVIASDKIIMVRMGGQVSHYYFLVLEFQVDYIIQERRNDTN